jgi:RNA recognition motif-containing protein
MQENDIRDFFQKERIPPAKVRMLIDNQGQFKGCAFVEFNSPDDYGKALKLDGHNVGGG